MKEEKKQCEGVSQNGYWKGYPCHNYGKYETNGKWYCSVHIGIAENEPERFEEAKKKLRKRKLEY